MNALRVRKSFFKHHSRVFLNENFQRLKKVKFLLAQKISTTNIFLKEAIKKMASKKKEGKSFFVACPSFQNFHLYTLVKPRFACLSPQKFFLS